jgi:hypothetical protein
MSKHKFYLSDQNPHKRASQITKRCSKLTMVYLILLIGKLVNIHMYYAPTNGNNQIKHANKTYFQQKEINFSTEICPRK